MKLMWTLVIIILTFLAISSGITKLILMPQEVDFFGKFGFSNPVLVGYGALQLIGGVLLAIKKTRFVGAAIVAATFLVSLVVLLLDGNLPMSIVTAVVTALLVLVMQQSRQKGETGP